MRDPGHRFSELERYEDSEKYTEREKVALRYTDVIVWDPTSADDALWAQLHAHFTEAEIVELGYWIGFTSGGQRWLQTLGTVQGDLATYIAGRRQARQRPTSETS